MTRTDHVGDEEASERTRAVFDDAADVPEAQYEEPGATFATGKSPKSLVLRPSFRVSTASSTP